MALGYAAGLRNAQLDQITAKLDAGAGAGTIKVYGTPRPATGAAVGGATLLATLTLSDPSAGAAAAGVWTVSAVTDDVAADASGTPVWFRGADSTGTFVMDGSAGGPASGADLEFNVSPFVAGGLVEITGGTITAGNA